MPDTKTSDIVDIVCETYPTFKRNNYFYGKLLTVNDFRMEQQYFVNKQRLTNRLIHGTGVVCGLNVKPKSPSSSGNTCSSAAQITIWPGVALDFCGREIVVSEPIDFDIQQNLPSNVDGKVYVYISYDFCGLDPVTKVLKSSNCRDDCCNGTIQECYKIEVFAERLKTQSVIVDACLWDQISSEDCPRSTLDGIFLAEVSFTNNNGIISGIQIDIRKRDVLLSNDTLYHLIKCIKNETQPIFPKIARTSWTHDYNWYEFTKMVENLLKDPLTIFFDTLMDECTVNDGTVSLTLECYNKNLAIPILVIKPQFKASTSSDTLRTTLQIIFNEESWSKIATSIAASAGVSAKELAGLTNSLPMRIGNYFSKLRLRVQINGNYILDKDDKKCLDGEFLGERFPTGDDKEGGLFESWINLKFPIDLGIGLQASPVVMGNPITFKTSVKTVPAPDVFHIVNLSYKFTSQEGGVKEGQLGTFNVGDGNITIPIDKLNPEIGTYIILLTYNGDFSKCTGDKYNPRSAKVDVTVTSS